MRILFLTQQYPPETGAVQNRLSELARRLGALGHCVTVLTAVPNYPVGEIFQEYRGSFVCETTEYNVRIIRTWIYATRGKSFFSRLASYWSFALMSAVVGLAKIPKQDFVIVESPPLFLGLSGLLLSWLKRSKLVMNISDLWPEAAVALGVLREGFLLKVAIRLEEYLYRKSAFITGQTEGIVENIRRRFPKKSIVLLPNGISPENILGDDLRQEARRQLRQEFGFDGHFVIGYTGLHGLAQGLETMLEAAKLLRHEKRIVFAFFGDGPEKQKLIHLAKDSNLDSVSFFPPQPGVRMPQVFAALDVAVVPLRRHPLFRGARPSKLLEAMGAAVPVIGSLEGEAQLIIEKSEAGICVEPENPHAMAQVISKLCGSETLCRTLGENGRRFVKRSFNRIEITEKLNAILNLAKSGVHGDYEVAPTRVTSTDGSGLVQQSEASSAGGHPEIK